MIVLAFESLGSTACFTYGSFCFCRGNEEAGLFVREAAYAILQQMYITLPPATIKDRVLAAVGGNKVHPARHVVFGYVNAN